MSDFADLSSLMDTQTGTLIGVPIPAEYEEKSIAIQKAVEQAVQDSVDSGIAKRGKEVTPWILARVKELTGGGSVQSSRYTFPCLVVLLTC
jgi:pseudouridine-5'-phosphate glycosidase/pseudouridine kinase